MKNQHPLIKTFASFYTPFSNHLKATTLLLLFLLSGFLSINAQVKIGANPGAIDANSLLELESTNKGFLPPRVTINDLSSVAPLTGTVPAGMLVYSSAGTVPDGYYYWNGTKWRLIETSELNAVAKTSNVTLAKTETLVLASSDIVLTLPAITSSDDGLAMTVKNIGAHTDRVKIIGAASKKIDGKDSSILTRWVGSTFIAYNGNWITKGNATAPENVLEVSPTGSWTTLEEAIDYLDEHMYAPAVIKLSGGSFTISATQVIDLDFPLTIQGASYSKATIKAGSGMTGPLFRCLSECFFKMLAFDGATYTTAGKDAIQFEGSGEYHEVKDCSFEGFNKTLVLETNVELWVFEVDIKNAVAAGIEVAAGGTSGITLKISEVDFTGCAIGVNLLSGNDAIVSILNSTFYNASAGIGVNYIPPVPLGANNFKDFSSMYITNNAWNNVGTFFSGFDFSRSDRRDAKAYLQNNAGDGDKKPYCFINVLNNSATTVTIPSANTWVKADWGNNTSSTTCKWTIDQNKITYQPENKRNAVFTIAGNLSVDNINRVISIGIVKNGSSTTRYGETTLRVTSQNQPFQFSFVAYLENVSPTDFFEIYYSSANANDIIKIQDIQWLATTQ